MTKKRDADEVVLSCTTCRTVSENVAPCNTRPEYPRTLVVPPEMLRTAVGLPPRRSTAHAVLNIGPPQSLTVNKGKCWDKDPGIPGPYGSCIFSEPYIAVWSKDGLTPLPAQIYIPGFNLNGLCIPSGDGKFPLVLIYHARGIAGQSPPTNHLGYDKLARHLASHGFIVASVNRGDGQPWLDSGELIEDHIDTLFNVYSTTKDRLQGGMALIGHSSGGTMVIRHAGRVRSPKNPAHKARNLAALVLFAPVLPSPFGEAEASLLASSTDAFLGLQAYNDEDSGAFGDKQVDQPMEVVFGVFDGFGNLPLNPHLSAALKDMVFASGETVPDHNFPLTHYFQNTVFALAYTTAFLHRNLNFNGAYDKYLREQAMPESIQKFYPPAYKFWQQHEDRARLVVANFTDPLGTIVSHSDFGIELSTGPAYMLDDFSPHRTNILQVKWDKTTSPAKFSSNFVKLSFVRPHNVSSFKYLAFRISYNYPGIIQELDLLIKMGGGSTLLGNHTSKLIPMVKYFKGAAPKIDATKNVMRTVVIPLASFGVALTAIGSITFDLAINPSNSNAKGVFNLGAVEFWKSSEGSDCA